MSGRQHRSPDTMLAWIASILNGAVGDYMLERRNELAIDMAFYHESKPLSLERAQLQHAYPEMTSKICVLVHGLGCTEGIWTFRDSSAFGSESSYGTLLQADRGFTPLYIRYNSGLPIVYNGACLADLLEQLFACYPLEIEEMVLIGHSMGGLVLHGAYRAGSNRGSHWVQRVSRIFYLGMPYDGADLEKLADFATRVLYAVPTAVTRLVGRILDRRSQGVKDLRFGARLPPEAFERPPDSAGSHERGTALRLPQAKHYLIAGALTEDPQHVATVLLGDGLVGLPRNGTPTTIDHALSLPTKHVRVFPQTNHFRLAADRAVYEQICVWCDGGKRASSWA